MVRRAGAVVENLMRATYKSSIVRMSISCGAWHSQFVGKPRNSVCDAHRIGDGGPCAVRAVVL